MPCADGCCSRLVFPLLCWLEGTRWSPALGGPGSPTLSQSLPKHRGVWLGKGKSGCTLWCRRNCCVHHLYLSARGHPLHKEYICFGCLPLTFSFLFSVRSSRLPALQSSRLLLLRSHCFHLHVPPKEIAGGSWAEMPLPAPFGAGCSHAVLGSQGLATSSTILHFSE